MRPADIETLDEMIKRNFTLHIYDNMASLYKETDFMRRLVA